MDTIQKGILALIKSGLTGQPASLEQGFSLEEALPVIAKHHLTPLVYEGAIHSGFGLRQGAVQQLLRGYCAHMLKSENQMSAVDRLCRAFDQAGIDHMPLKGCNMKRLYPKPELRLMGDADILIRTEQYDAIRTIVTELGYEEKVESDHEFVWVSKDLFLELHKRLIPSYNRDYHAYFGDGWRLAKKESGCRYTMTPEDEFIYLFTHFAKHYRDGGIGCRHVADLWVFLRSHPRLDRAYVRRELHKLDLERFYDHIRRVLAVWFEDAAEDGITELITQFIFDSGSWGQKEAHILSAAVKSAREAGSLRGGRLRSIRKTLLPDLKNMCRRYPVLEKAPWLLPVMWPYRWADAALNRRGSVRSRHQALKMETPEAVDGYQQSLRLVGLDFNFGK